MLRASMPHRTALLVRVGLAGLLLGACSSKVQTTGNYAAVGAGLPRPDLVVVHDFTASPSDVQLDSGVGARLRRSVGGVPDDITRAGDVQQVQAAITTTLVRKINNMGIPAVANGRGVEAGNVLSVQGQIREINEGNRTRRTVVGLGAGKSAVAADVQIIYVPAGSGPRLLQTFAATSNSGRAPGAAETLGAGAAMGRLATSAAVTGGMHALTERRRAGVDDDASRLADQLARTLQTSFVQQGWISGR